MDGRLDDDEVANVFNRKQRLKNEVPSCSIKSSPNNMIENCHLSSSKGKMNRYVAGRQSDTTHMSSLNVAQTANKSRILSNEDNQGPSSAKQRRFSCPVSSQNNMSSSPISSKVRFNNQLNDVRCAAKEYTMICRYCSSAKVDKVLDYWEVNFKLCAFFRDLLDFIDIHPVFSF